MTSVFRSINDAMPDDNGRDIDDNVAATQSRGRTVDGPSPIQPIEYLLFQNSRFEYGIKEKFERALLERNHPPSVEDTEEYKKIWSVFCRILPRNIR